MDEEVLIQKVELQEEELQQPTIDLSIDTSDTSQPVVVERALEYDSSISEKDDLEQRRKGSLLPPNIPKGNGDTNYDRNEMHRLKQEIRQKNKEILELLVEGAKEHAPRYNVDPSHITLKDIQRQFNLDLYKDGDAISNLNVRDILTKVYQGKTITRRALEKIVDIIMSLAPVSQKQSEGSIFYSHDLVGSDSDNNTHQRTKREEIEHASKKNLEFLVERAKQEAPKYGINSSLITSKSIQEGLDLELYRDAETIFKLALDADGNVVHDILTEVYEGKTRTKRALDNIANAVATTASIAGITTTESLGFLLFLAKQSAQFSYTHSTSLGKSAARITHEQAKKAYTQLTADILQRSEAIYLAKYSAQTGIDLAKYTAHTSNRAYHTLTDNMLERSEAIWLGKKVLCAPITAIKYIFKRKKSTDKIIASTPQNTQIIQPPITQQKQEEEEERRKKELEEQARKAREQPRTPKSHTINRPPQGLVLSTTYKDVEFEQTTARKQRSTHTKQCFYFNDSLSDLKRRGFERHARPQEAFGLVIDGLEGKLTGNPKAIHDDMLASCSEWLSLAFERKGNVLICYLDPEGLAWDKDSKKYVGSVRFSEKRDFDITGKPSQYWVDLKDFNEDFVRFLYGRSFNELPQEMKKGNKTAQACLPPDGVVWPIGRHDPVEYDGHGYCYCVMRASRGERSVQKNSTGNRGS